MLATQGGAKFDDQGTQRHLEKQGLKPALELIQDIVNGRFGARVKGADRLEISRSQRRGKRDGAVDIFQAQRQRALLRAARRDPQIPVWQNTDPRAVDPPGIGVPERNQAPVRQTGACP